jgi:hypothetical protein
VIVFREIVERDSAILPDESEINEFINVIGEFEKYSGVVVTQVQGLSRRDRGRGKGKREAIIKIPMKIKLRGSYDQFLRFLNHFENYDRFVRISGFSIAQGSHLGPGGAPQHEINLELVTYQYNPGGGPVKRVEIPNYERRKQDLEVQKRIRQSKPAHIEKYPLKPRISRRDPLLDPRETETPVADDGVDPEERFKQEKQLLEKLVLQVSLLQEDVRMEEKLRKNHDFMRIVPITKAIEERINQLDFQIQDVLAGKRITVPELKDEFISDVVQPYEQVKDRRAVAQKVHLILQRDQVFKMYRTMQEKYEAEEYKDVITVYQGFLQLSEGKRIDEEAKPLQEQMLALATNAEKIVKFESEALDIDGVIIDPKRRSYTIINGRILAEGDTVDADGKIKIRKIDHSVIEFVYQDVVIKKHLRKK